MLLGMQQIAVRLPEDLLAEVDRLIGEGVVESRAQAVRTGLLSLVESERRARTDRLIVEGYSRIPPGPAETAAAEAGLRAAIAEEPW